MRDDLKKLTENWPVDVPFERAVRKNLRALRQLIVDGMTWKTIAGALTRAGVRKRNGSLMSARQINTVFLRVSESEAKSRENDDFAKNPAALESQANPLNSSPPMQPTLGVKRITAKLNRSTQTQDTLFLSSSSPDLARRLAEARRLGTRKRPGFDE
jgi:hypothetical protein